MLGNVKQADKIHSKVNFGNNGDLAHLDYADFGTIKWCRKLTSQN